MDRGRFETLRAKKGGAIYLDIADYLKTDDTTSTKYQITNTKFITNLAFQGGAFYIHNPQRVKLANVEFHSN